MRKAFLLLTAAFFVLTLGTAVLDSATGCLAAAPLGVEDDPQAPPAPPQAVSPADPKTPPPDVGRWVCPHCGTECPGPAWQKKGHFGRPQLGPGREACPNPRPGRYGREGGREDRAAMGPRAHRHGTGRAGLRGPGHQGGFAAEMMLRHAKDLDLTEDQIKNLEGLAYETKKTLVDLHAEIEKSQIEIQELIHSGSDDLAQIRRHLEAVSNARVEIQEARIAQLFEARKVLTAKQKKMLKEEFPRLGGIVD